MTSERREREFPPHVLQEYAFLGDGERGVLVGPKGDYAWMCAPRWDSDAVFSSLIGGAGVYALHPERTRFVWGGYYEPNSLIWRSRWITTNSIVECREALAFPGDPHKAVLLRRVCALRGGVEIGVVLDLRSRFGVEAMVDVHEQQGRWCARSGALRMRWTGASGARVADDGALELHFSLAEGEARDFVLEISDAPLGEPVPSGRMWEATEAAWRADVPDLTGVLSPKEVGLSYAVLRGLTCSSGAMVAAATTSLPERAQAGRSYDYRYAWIRDQCYTGQAIAAHAPHALIDRAVSFVSERLLDDGPSLRPAYTVSGGEVPDERSLGNLAGYPGGSDRIGNWVNKQFQLDAFGEALLLFAAASKLDRLDREHWQAVETAVKSIEQRWRDPDAGVWELHPNRWAHSRLACVAGLRAIASSGGPSPELSAWISLADAILAEVSAESLHPSGRWQRAPDDDRVDAALLLPAVRGAVPPQDPRSVATYDEIRHQLGRHGYVYRFRHDERPLDDSEGAFVLCGFWMALAAHQQGHTTQAMQWFERNRSAAGPPGIYTEEFDVVQHQLRGNTPQAFVHALMLEAASRLAEPWP